MALISLKKMSLIVFTTILKFDAEGNLVSWDGSPILLNGTIPRDDDILAALNVYRPGILELQNKVVGYTKVLLDGSTCRREECNLGNLIADAMVNEYALTYKDDNNYWTDAAIAFIQGGGNSLGDIQFNFV